MGTESKIFENGQAISIKKKTMEHLNLEIGDILNVEKEAMKLF